MQFILQHKCQYTKPNEKGQKDKQWFTKHEPENLRLGNRKPEQTGMGPGAPLSEFELKFWNTFACFRYEIYCLIRIK